MKSMTGYGYSEYQDEKNRFMLSLRSYNNRYLDINIYVPSYLSQLEPKIRSYLVERIKRGRVELSLKVDEMEEEIDVRLDKQILGTYLNVFKEIIVETGLQERISLSNILRIDGVLKTKKNYDIDRYWAKIEKLLAQLFEEFDRTRVVEGQRTAETIRELAEQIAGHVALVDQFVPRIETKIKELVLRKFKEVLGDELEESRMLAEIAVLMIKYDIREEVQRMGSHLQSIRQIIAEGGAMSKKLDFLCQELNREINTIGSKSIFLEVNNAVISVKDQIETIREQLRNVE